MYPFFLPSTLLSTISTIHLSQCPYSYHLMFYISVLSSSTKVSCTSSPGIYILNKCPRWVRVSLRNEWDIKVCETSWLYWRLQRTSSHHDINGQSLRDIFPGVTGLMKKLPFETHSTCFIHMQTLMCIYKWRESKSVCSVCEKFLQVHSERFQN